MNTSNSKIIKKSLRIAVSGRYLEYIDTFNGGYYINGKRNVFPSEFVNMDYGNVLYGVGEKIGLFDIIALNKHWGSTLQGNLLIGLYYNAQKDESYNVVLDTSKSSSELMLCLLNENTEDPLLPVGGQYRFDDFMKIISY